MAVTTPEDRRIAPLIDARVSRVPGIVGDDHRVAVREIRIEAP